MLDDKAQETRGSDLMRKAGKRSGQKDALAYHETAKAPWGASSTVENSKSQKSEAA